MTTLHEYLLQSERRRGEEEACLLRFGYLLILLLWSLLGGGGVWLSLAPLILMGTNGVYLGRLHRDRSALPASLFLGGELVLAALWSYQLGGSPLMPAILSFLILYAASLRLHISLILLGAGGALVLMNGLYLCSLWPMRSTLGLSPLAWPGFSSQVTATLSLLLFSFAAMSRPRIIRRLVRKQQDYFDRSRSEQTDLEPAILRLCAEGDLSGREQEVLKVLIQGKTYRMIAGELFISTDTVKSHVKSIYRKTGVGSRGELLTRLREQAPLEG